MKNKEKFLLKLKIMEEAYESDTPAKVFEKYHKKYPDIIDKDLVKIEKKVKLSKNKI